MASESSIELALPQAPADGEWALIAQAAGGDHDAYATLIRPHEHVAYRVAVAITGWNADAQEAVQNAFVQAYRSLGRVHRGRPFRPWLLRIVVHEAHNVRRSERRHQQLAARAAERHEAAAAPADEALAAREDAATVIRAVAALPENDRVALALRYFAELPDADAAALVGVSASAHRVRELRARRRLRKLLDEADD